MATQSQRTSLSQTMTQIRNRYQARSSQSNAGPYNHYSPYSPYTGGMPVMPTTVGMRAIGETDLAKLQQAFQTIYTGDPTISHRACNHLESFGYNFDIQNYWGLDVFDSEKTKPRTERNAIAWGNYVKTVAQANNALGGDVLKCLISRPLVGLHRHPDPDVSEDHHWSLPEIERYVRLTINNIDAIRTAGIHPNPRSLVAGWVWNNDGIGHDEHKDNPEMWLSVLNRAHNAQKACGVNWPFYWADPLDFVDPACGPDGCKKGSTPQFWRPSPGTQDPNYPDWTFHVPKLVDDLITGFPSDATPVFMLQHYSWTTEKGWDYTRQPPWRVLKKILEALDAKFSRSTRSKLRIEVSLHAAEKIGNSDLTGPGHADIHKQIRVATEIGNELDEDHDDKRFTGFWFMGWNGVHREPANTQNLAESNWTTGRRFAEAIQNEPHGIEGIQDAIPGATNILQNFPNPFYIDPETDDDLRNPMVTRIPYHLAERKKFRIEIYRPQPDRPNKKGELIRTIDEGYTGESPQGRFANTHRTGPGIPEHMDLNGTSAHWDGRDEMTKEVPPLSHDEPCHDYKAYLIVGEKPNETTYGPVTMTKTPSPPPPQRDEIGGDDDGPVKLILEGPNIVTRGYTTTYTASITTPPSVTLDAPLTFNWKYTADIRRNTVRVTENISAIAEVPQRTTWTGTMVKSGTLEVRTTVDGKKYVQTMNVTVNDRPWVTEVPITTNTTSLDVEAPRQHSDLGDVEYDIPFTAADDLKTRRVESGPNKGILYIVCLNLTAPLTMKINRHFGMAEADFPPPWVAFKNANTRYGKIEAKVKARLGFDETTRGTLSGNWKRLINSSDPKEDLEDFMQVPGTLLSNYKQRIQRKLSTKIENRIAVMNRRKAGWSPSGITINYNYFAAQAGRDQAVDVNTTVTFDGSGSRALAGRTIASYSWNFGSDATPATGTGVAPSCTYSSSGAKTVTLTVTDSGGDADSDTTIVTVRKRHHNIPVGMMAIEHEELSGLQTAFEDIYTGEPDNEISMYQACNHLHSYGYNFDNAGTRGSDQDYWGLNNSTENRGQRNAQAWANYVKTVAEANTAVGGGNLKCLISRPLMGLYRHTESAYPNWSLSELRSYVHHTIHKIDAIDPSIHPNPRSLVAGWYLNDDGFPRNIHGKEEWEDVVCEVHTAQKQCGVYWPFYWADNIDDYTFHQSVKGRHEFFVPQKLKDWVGAFPDDATPVFMPYYYPWQSGNWEYTINPPWKKWRVFMERLHEAFFGTEATITHPNLKFHPILEAARETDPNGTYTDSPPPGHADMHKQIRVVWELLQTYSSVTGIWVLGWNKGVDISRAIAKENWTGTDNRRYAEAFQNELYGQEGIRDAIPDANKLLLNSPVKFKQKIRIPYSLRDRRSFNIRIYDKPISEIGAKWIRTINDGYYGASPPGKFVNSPIDSSSHQELAGTSAYWDGMYWDTTDGNVYTSADDGDYYVYLFFINTVVHGPLIIRKDST